MGGFSRCPQVHLFLSPAWVHEVTRVIQAARKTDKHFGQLAVDFSLRLEYLIKEIPEQLRRQYGGGSQAAIFVQLDHGAVRKINIGRELPGDPVDFTVTSTYQVARMLYQAELNAATSFINRSLSVEPLRRLYQQPNFAAKSVVAGNLLLKIARQVPTAYA